MFNVYNIKLNFIVVYYNINLSFKKALYMQLEQELNLKAILIALFVVIIYK